ncbi:lysine biosynthesis protein LysX [Candidatus Bathyarchaeota archaeon]|nr:MAG: lysine biosynthesis protein LysX [Candidatus Hecatellales archaeon]RLI34461.1 MAG: lysine biosynthesis protein LysX [Candidatus Bathyarchaeota archaeon]
MPPTISIIYDQIRWEEKAVRDAALARGIPVNLIDAKKAYFNLVGEEKEPENFGDVVLQRCVSYFRNLHITAILESKGYSVVNSYDVTNVCGNKLLTTLKLAKAGVPTPKTYVAFTPEGALKAAEEVGYPLLIKPVIGSWGRLIVPLKDRETAEAVFEERLYMFPLYQVYYLQEIVKRPPRDLRVFVIGDEAVAGIYRYSLDIKTNIARGGKAEACHITDELREISLKAAEAVGGGILGVDLMELDGGYVVHEINHTIEFHATVSVTGVNIPKYILGYLLRKARR